MQHVKEEKRERKKGWRLELEGEEGKIKGRTRRRGR